MKKSIIIALIAIVIIIFFSILSIVITADYTPNSFIRLTILFLILSGVLTGHKLAWQWGRLLTLLALFGILAAMLLMIIKAYDPIAALLGFLLSIPMLTIFIAFGRDSAREHFGLICPRCNSFKVKADDFLYRQAKCKECNHTW